MTQLIFKAHYKNKVFMGWWEIEFWWVHINSNCQEVHVCLETLKPRSLRKARDEKPHLAVMSTIGDHCAVGNGPCHVGCLALWADCDWTSLKGEWLPSHQHQSHESIPLTSEEILLSKWMPERSSIFQLSSGSGTGERVERKECALERLKKPLAKHRNRASFHFA